MLPIKTQMFLQLLSNERIMSVDDVRREATFIFGEDCSENEITIINRKLKRYNFTIKSEICEVTGQKYWIFCSDTIDKNMDFNGEFTDLQLEFIRNMFSEIINSEDGYISSIHGINVGSTMGNKFSPLLAEDLIRVMEEQKWLNITEGKIFMGVRSIGELLPYFKESYVNNLSICPACSKTVFHGHRCENCLSVSHFYCLARILKFQRNVKCISCKTDINVDNLPQVNEIPMEMDTIDDVDDTDTIIEVSQRAKTSKKPQRKGKRSQ